MSSVRLAGIPLEHVVAEMAAFPLASEAALTLNPQSLDPCMSGNTGELWRAAECSLLSSFPAISVEEIVAIRDRLWFENGDATPVTFAHYLRQMARWYLAAAANAPAVAVPKLLQCEHISRTSEIPQARRSWLWLSFAFPPDYLLGALGQGVVGPSRVDLLDGDFARELNRKGFAETHLHVGAALDFPMLWKFLLHEIAASHMTGESFRGPGAVFNEGRELGNWLIHAILSRYLLAAFHASGKRAEGFAGYFHGEMRNRLVGEIGSANMTFLGERLASLQIGHVDAGERNFNRLKSLYAQISRVTTLRLPKSLRKARAADPAMHLLPGKPVNAPEVRWLRAGLEYLESSSGKHDSDFALLFWQVVRVRAVFYRHVVQRPLTPGLQWFVRFYARGRAARGRVCVSNELLLETAASLGGAGHGLQSLEIRTSPESSIQGFTGYIEELNKQAWAWRKGGVTRDSDGRRSRKALEFGLVCHFTKRRGGGAEEGKPQAHWQGSFADPRMASNPTGYRYSRFYKEKRQEAIALAWLLRHRPLSLHIVRGLDVCTDELGAPNWVMAPLLARVREAATSGSRALQNFHQPEAPPLCTTVHAGEDFVHLLTGLRNVDEAILQFQLKNGDRIGHGVALGVDPQDWARRAGRVPILSEVRLFDLVWAATLNKSDPNRHDTEIAELSERIFGEALPSKRIAKLWQNLSEPAVLHRAGFPDGPAPSGNISLELAHVIRYLTDAKIYTQGRKVIWVDASADADETELLQIHLREKICERQLTVEINPTSNLLIGDLNELGRHPLWRLNDPTRKIRHSVPVCIGSDDPILFGSNLRHEYQFVRDALDFAGVDARQRDAWMDQVRSTGMSRRFTLQRNAGFGIADFFNPIETTDGMLF